MFLYAINHNPLCSMRKYFLLPQLLWVLGSISAWKIMSLTSVSKLETSKYCRVLFTNIHLGVIPFLLSSSSRIQTKTLPWHMLPSCQLSRGLLLGPGSEFGLTRGTKGWCPFLVQSCSPGRANCYSGLLSEANHEWSICPINQQVGFSIGVQHFPSALKRDVKIPSNMLTDRKDTFHFKSFMWQYVSPSRS